MIDVNTGWKIAIILLLGLGLSACAARQAPSKPGIPETAIVGEKPKGYPRTTVRQLPDRHGFCVEITETLREDTHQGQTIWLKEKAIRSVNCSYRPLLRHH